MTYYQGNTSYKREPLKLNERLMMVKQQDENGNLVWGWLMSNGKFCPKKED